MPPQLDATQIESRLADLVVEISSLQLLVLAGSVVRGTATESSDIDLGVLCIGEFDPDSLYLAIAPRLGTDRIDLVDLRRASPLLAFEFGRSGKLLFERKPGIFRGFHSLAYRRYCDTEKLRQGRKLRIHRFLQREGLR